ncbi:MAG TPA: DUF6328 family protein, partial [Lentzea sp.]
REEVVRVGNAFALVGLAFLALAMSGTVLLLAEVILPTWAAVVVGVVALVVFTGLWFAAPFSTKGAEHRERP